MKEKGGGGRVGRGRVGGGTYFVPNFLIGRRGRDRAQLQHFAPLGRGTDIGPAVAAQHGVTSCAQVGHTARGQVGANSCAQEGSNSRAQVRSNSRAQERSNSRGQVHAGHAACAQGGPRACTQRRTVLPAGAQQGFGAPRSGKEGGEMRDLIR